MRPFPLALLFAGLLFVGLTAGFIALLVIGGGVGNRVATVGAALLATGAAWLVAQLRRERGPRR